MFYFDLDTNSLGGYKDTTSNWRKAMRAEYRSHKRRVGNGPAALKRRRQIALDNLLKVKDPDKRQAAEIDALQKRVGRG